MALLFIRIRLVMYLSVFAADLAGVYIQQIRPLLWSLLVLATLILGAAHTYFTTLAMVRTEKIVAVTVPDSVPHASILLTRNSLETTLAQQQKLLALQPQHKDILLNISLLQKSLQNQKESFLSWEEARKLDPNNQIFSLQKTQ